MKNLNDLFFTPHPLLDSEQEKKRLEYKPKNVRYLLVGESMPSSGDFFYDEDSILYKYTKEVFLNNFDWPEKEFLELFKSNNFYLDDLCLEPVDKLGDDKRKRAREAYEENLSMRIKEYHPLIIITLFKNIKNNVNRALNKSSLNIENIVVTSPFDYGGPSKYVDELSRAIKNKVKPLFNHPKFK